jgi:hypothetical protein
VDSSLDAGWLAYQGRRGLSPDRIGVRSYPIHAR